MDQHPNGKIEPRRAPGFPVRAIRDQVIIETMEVGATFAPGGLIERADISKKRARRGRVVSTGPGFLDPEDEIWKHPPAQVGDVVLYGAEWQGCDINVDGQVFRTLDGNQVYAVIEGDPDRIE